LTVDIPIITEMEQLQAFAERLEQHASIAIDLEADSMHHFREQACLLQFSTPEETLLVDPLRLANLDPLQKVLADPAIRKLFHAADYDLRCLRRDFNLQVRGLFDTMVASQFCGEEKFGLADLLNKYFSVQLDKKFQRADWTIRPLPHDMMNYAAEDTRHLERLAEIMTTNLRKLDREDWVAEECQLLEQVAFVIQEGPRFLRFKGAGKLERRQLAILELLLEWREAEAERRDVPPFKVFGNQGLLAIVLNAPETLPGMASLEGVFPRLIDRYGKQLLHLIDQAQSLPAEQLPQFPRGVRRAKEPEVEKRLSDLKQWRTQKAAELKLDAGLLINNALLEELARIQPRQPGQMGMMKNWQRKMLGEEVLRVLAKN
jgi:ribonuclease D